MSMGESGNGDLGRDPALARLYGAATAEGRDEPPPALDAAIQAAARRAVGAGPQSAAGARPGGARRNWYVPMSLAAVLVLSVSLVTLMRHEKGDEVYQPSAGAPAPPAVEVPAAPATDAVPTPAAVPESSGESSATLRRDATTAREAESRAPAAAGEERPLAVEPRRSSAAAARKEEHVPPKPVSSAGQQAADASIATMRTKRASPAKKLAQPQASADAGLADEVANSAPVQTPAVPRSAPPAVAAKPARPAEVLAEPFPGAMEREAKREFKADAPTLRRQAEGAPSGAAPEPDGAADADVRRKRAAAQDLPEARSMFKTAPASPTSRPAWLVELDNEPPEKWLQRLAQLRRDGHDSVAQALLAEFRRRFPDHPFSR